MKLNLTDYMKAGYSILYVETLEVKRAIKNITIDEMIGEEQTNKIYWNFVDGFPGTHEAVNNPSMALDACTCFHSKTMVILENFNNFFDIEVVQKLLNYLEVFKDKQIMLVMVGENPKLPAVIEKLVTIIDFPLPSIDEFEVIGKDLCNQVNIPYIQSVIESCTGLSMEEGENALALSIVKNKELDKETVLEMKRQMIKKTGFMDYMEPETIENLGGLGNLKDYLFKRKRAWESGSTLPKLRSILLLGVPGTGKTLSAKVISSIFNWPLISFDIGATKASLVGESEKKIREGTKVIDAHGQAVVIFDEIEKSLSGSGENLDSGVSAGILGHLLTWMQESKGEKIIIATANNISGLPPELLRSGRFDTIFFVGFPTEEERIEIINIMNKKWGSELPIDMEFVNKLDNFTGAEIEQLAKDSLFDDDLDLIIKNIPNVANVKKVEISKMLEFSKQVRLANGIKKHLPAIRKTLSRKITSENLDDKTKETITRILKKKGE